MTQQNTMINSHLIHFHYKINSSIIEMKYFNSYKNINKKINMVNFDDWDHINILNNHKQKYRAFKTHLCFN